MSKKNDEQLIALAHKRFRIAAEAESRIREAALDDFRFRSGDQWPEDVRKERELDKRPCLVVNRLPSFLRQVTNEQRQNRPAIQVDPVDDFGDPETAEIEQGLIRHIERSSGADVAYDTAFEHMSTGGFGYIRVLTDYVSEDSFDQEIKIKRVKDPFCVYFDPHIDEPDGSDGRYCFLVDDMPADEYKAQYPDSELASFDNFSAIGDRGPRDWISEQTVRVAEYMYVETKRRTLCLMPDGSKVFADQQEGAEKEAIRTRPVEERTVNWVLMNGMEVLERREWPGKWLPIIPVYGDEIIVDGERQLVGVIRYAKDPQRMYNYWASAETETIALAPRAPYVGVEGQFEGHEHEWAAANRRNFPYLQYKPKSAGGQFAPPPQRQVYEPPIQAISMARMQAADDLKATTGIFDASLGAQSNETSGKAILARQREGDVANFNFIDNLSRSMRHLGRVLIDLIPKIYDTPRVLRIIGKEDEQKTVKVNQPTVGKGGVERIFDLTAGKYDVTVNVGPSYSSKRQEAAESMMALTQAYPALMQVAGDLLVKNMDWPGAAKIAERLKRLLPPEILQEEEEEGQPKQQIPPQMLQAFMQQNEQLSAALNEATEMLEGRMAELQMQMQMKEREIESRERIESMKIEADLAKTQATIDQKNALASLQAEIDQLNQWQARIDQQQAQYLQMHEANAQRDHEAGMAQMSHMQSREAAAEDADRQMMMQQQEMPEAD
jgi:hypothetical protein